MSDIVAIAAGVLCFLFVLTVIVVVHEAGHAWVARRCGARVTEFFVGMPFGPEASRRSSRSGIKYGVTFALLGGYTKIAGMLPPEDERLPFVLALVNARGRISVDEVAEVLGCDAGEAQTLLAALADWGSIEEEWPEGARHARNDYPDGYRTVRRDAKGLTVFDRGHDFSVEGVSPAGAPYLPAVGADDFFEAESSRTYQGLNLPKRLAVLVAGVFCNLLLAFAIFMAYYMIHGVAGVASLDVAEVQAGSAAAEAGMVAGDRVVSVGGEPVDSYADLGEALADVRGGGEFELVYSHNGVETAATAELAEDEALGVYYGVAYRGLGFAEAAACSAAYIGEVAAAVASLLVPSQTAEVLEGSAGVVGIAAMTQDAVSSGFWPVLLLIGMLSLSLGWMNLLPIPPLDGGKVLIELVQGVIRRPVPPAVQGVANLVGIALFLLLFVFMVFQDVTRLAGM